MSETPTTTAPLTPEDIAFVTERCLGSIAHRFNERLILEAADEAETIRAVLHYNSFFGRYGDDYFLEGRGQKITFSRDGRAGTVTWAQIVRSVRASLAPITQPDAVQLDLFPSLP